MKIQQQETNAKGSDNNIASLVSSSINAVIEPVKRAAASPAIKRAIVSSLVLAAVVSISVATAVVAYAVFYYLYIPQVGFQKQVWLQYG